MTKKKQVLEFLKDNTVAQTAKHFRIKQETVTRYTRQDNPPEISEAPVLILPDIHAPYHHPNAIEFFKYVHKLRGCRKRVVSVGDIVDFHSMSRHISETDADSPECEYEKALKFTAELCQAFPEGDVVLGNHDMIPQRQMKDIGLASSLLKQNNELYGLSSGWKVHPLYYVIDPDGWNVLVEHGIGSGGKYGCANTAKEKRCSYVQGHTHSAAAVIYSQNHESSIFGMNVGCCVDSASLALRYGRYGTRKGVVGCGVVYSGSHAEFFPMSSWRG